MEGGALRGDLEGRQLLLTHDRVEVPREVHARRARGGLGHALGVQEVHGRVLAVLLALRRRVGEPADEGEEGLVPHQPAQVVQEPRALEVDVAAGRVGALAGEVHVLGGAGGARGDRPRVADSLPVHLQLLAVGLRAEARLQVEGLHVGPEALVDPEVGPVVAGHQVGPPLVAQLVVVEPVVVEVRVAAELVAVGDDALVLHAQVRRLDHAVLVDAEGIGPAHRLHVREVIEDLLEQGGRAVGALGEVPEGHRVGVPGNALHLARDALVGRDVERDGVVRDRRAGVPVEGASALVPLRDAGEPAVGGAHEARGHRDLEVEGVGLVRGVVLAGPPEVRALHLAAGGDPGRARGRLGPGEAPDPGRVGCNARRAGVQHSDLQLVPGRALGPGQRDADAALLVGRLHLGAPDRDAMDLEASVEVEGDDLGGPRGRGGHRERARDELAVWHDRQDQLVVVDVVAGLVGAEGTSGLLRLGRGRSGEEQGGEANSQGRGGEHGARVALGG